MTAIASWIGVDEITKQTTSLYLVSDSKLSALATATRAVIGKFSEDAQKLFACRLEPHIFGYSGWASYPTGVLESLVDLIDEYAVFSKTDGFSVRQAKILVHLEGSLSKALKNSPDVPQPFSIAHGVRQGSRKKARFVLRIMEWSPGGNINVRRKYMRKESVMIFRDGTGKRQLRLCDKAWRKSEIGKKSRGVFGAFCDMLDSHKDPQTGGAPQLVRLFTTGGAQYVGTIYHEKRYLKGKCVDRYVPSGYKWFNETMERVDSLTKKLVKGGQRQPRPGNLAKNRRAKSIFDKMMPPRSIKTTDVFGEI
jgi:hypothetical protein